MIRVQKLARPNKHSGHALQPGKTTTVKKVVITNENTFPVFVDKFTRPHWDKKKKKKKK